MRTILNEVKESEKKEQLLIFLKKNKKKIFFSLILIFSSILFFQILTEYKNKNIKKNNSKISIAIRLTHMGKTKSAINILKNLAGQNNISSLAHFRKSSLYLKEEKLSSSYKELNIISRHRKHLRLYEDLAFIEKSIIKINNSELTYKKIKELILSFNEIANPRNPLHFSAYEMLGILHFLMKKNSTAQEIFKKIKDDLNAPYHMRKRAEKIVATLIR